MKKITWVQAQDLIRAAPSKIKPNLYQSFCNSIPDRDGYEVDDDIVKLLRDNKQYFEYGYLDNLLGEIDVKDGWYKSTLNPYGYFIKLMDGIVVAELGGEVNKFVTNPNVIYNSRYYKLASFREIETRLWEEANRRGLFKDTKIKEHACPYISSEVNDNSYDIGYRFDDRLLNKNGSIYYQGNWAEPLQDPKEKQVTKTKRWEIKIIYYNDGTSQMSRENHGFNAIELLGLCANVSLDVQEQIKGNIEPTVINRTVIKD